MEIKGRCWIAKKPKSEELDFVNYGKVASGTISWQNKIKTKEGEYKATSYKRFTIFGDGINTIESNLGKMFEIEGFLRTEFYDSKELDEEGKPKRKSSEKIIINRVDVYENVQSQQESIKQIKQNLDIQDDVFESDDIPF